MINIREQLAQDLLGCDYAALSAQKKSVIDLVADQRPTGVGPLIAVDERDTWQKLADNVAKVGGSWSFIITFGVILAVWVSSNLVLTIFGRAFDPYPFIFLNLLLSMVAALQAPIIMMSQNRQAAIDRAAAEHDYVVNLRAELEIMLLHDKLDAMRDRDVLTRLDEVASRLTAIDARMAQLPGQAPA